MSATNFSTEVLERVRKLRGFKEYSQEYMGKQLGLTQKGYSALETGEVPLSIDRLSKIAEILEVDVFELLSFDEKILFNNYNHSNQTGFFGTFYGNVSNGELYEKIVKQLEAENTHLKQQIEKLHKIIDKLGGQ
jgi:transcriptional regulator with XRE-family HTH domain